MNTHIRHAYQNRIQCTHQISLSSTAQFHTIPAQYHGKTVLVGVDDLDIFKGIELKLEAMERVLREYPELRGQLVLVQITNAPRADSPDLLEVHQYIMHLVERINTEYGSGDYKPIVWETMQAMHDRVAYYSIADVAVVTATRDGMNLVPYEYVTCRQGAQESPLPSMLVVSEFVGCSPSLSGAIRCAHVVDHALKLCFLCRSTVVCLCVSCVQM